MIFKFKLIIVLNTLNFNISNNFKLESYLLNPAYFLR